jgi:hypothetical protein
MSEIPAHSDTLSNAEERARSLGLRLTAGHARLAASKLFDIQRAPFGKADFNQSP